MNGPPDAPAPPAPEHTAVSVLVADAARSGLRTFPDGDERDRSFTAALDDCGAPGTDIPLPTVRRLAADELRTAVRNVFTTPPHAARLGQLASRWVREVGDPDDIDGVVDDALVSALGEVERFEEGKGRYADPAQHPFPVRENGFGWVCCYVRQAAGVYNRTRREARSQVTLEAWTRSDPAVPPVRSVDRGITVVTRSAVARLSDPAVISPDLAGRTRHEAAAATELARLGAAEVLHRVDELLRSDPARVAADNVVQQSIKAVAPGATDKQIERAKPDVLFMAFTAVRLTLHRELALGPLRIAVDPSVLAAFELTTVLLGSAMTPRVLHLVFQPLEERVSDARVTARLDWLASQLAWLDRLVDASDVRVARPDVDETLGWLHEPRRRRPRPLKTARSIGPAHPCALAVLQAHDRLAAWTKDRSSR